MDAFELLKNDHKKVSRIFEEIESASGQAKSQLFSRLKRELDLHAHIEEKIFYPALENTEAAREITLEAYEEHKVVKDLLSELAGGGAPDDEWDAKLTVLKENVEHHVDEEEGELFSKARQALTRDQIERFGTEMEAEKARQQGGSPRPSAPEAARRDSQRTSQSTSQKDQSPGVLKRIASLVGLGDSSESSSKKASGRRSGGTSKRATTKKAAGRGSSTKQSAKSATRKSASTKAGTKKSATKKAATKKSGSKTRGAATAKRASKKSGRKSSGRQASVGARSSARKTAARPAGSKNTARGATKRGRAK